MVGFHEFDFQTVSSIIGTQTDPYVIVRCGSGSFKTNVKPSNLNPVWNQTHSFTVANPATEVVYFQVYDHDLIGNHDSMGSAQVSLNTLQMKIPSRQTLTLLGARHGTLVVELTALDFGAQPMGYPPQQPMMGYPQQQPMGYPPQGYPPQQPMMGYPPQQPMGYPQQPMMGYPPQQPTVGYAPQPQMGYPPQQGYGTVPPPSGNYYPQPSTTTVIHTNTPVYHGKHHKSGKQMKKAMKGIRKGFGKFGKIGKFGKFGKKVSQFLIIISN